MTENSGFTQEDRRLAAAGLAAQGWHLDKKVSISVIVALVGIIAGMFLQTIYVTSYFTKLDSRVETLEVFKNDEEKRQASTESVNTRLAVVERVQIDMIKRLDVQTDKMDRMLTILGKNGN